MLKPIALLGVLLVASPTFAAKATLSGQVTYRERIALPETAVLSIELVDLALPDRPRVRVSAPTGAGQVPLGFTLTFEDSMILPQHDYAINAEIEAGDIRFRNTEPYAVNPLAQSEPILVVTQMIAATGETSKEPTSPVEQLPILGITWSATAIAGTPVPPGVDVTLLIEDDMRAGGVGGCNSYFSQATVTREGFAIGELSRTLRSCGYDLNMLEQSFFDALRKTTSWHIDGETLVLRDAAGASTATLER